MIADIRDYFRQVINEVDSDLKEHDEALSSDKISDTILENTYFLKIGDIQSSRLDTTIESLLTVTLDFWKNGYNKPVENYDEAYCKAIDIQALSMYQPRIDQQGDIKSVECVGIRTDYSATNDNLYKFSLEFTVRLCYKYQI